MPLQHKDLPPEHAHTPYRWIVADATARSALAVTADDIGKRLWQQADDTEWTLKSADPAQWVIAAPVQSVHGRTGDVTAKSGDYTPAQVGADPAGTASSAVTSHEQAANPHDQYVQKVTGKGLSTEDYTTAEKDKLAAVESEATKNATDAHLLNRENHTGTQSASTISDFDSQASAAAPVQTVDGQTGAVDLSGSYEQKRQNNLSSATDPTATDDASAGYEPLSRWINTSTGEIWLCVDATNGAANWQKASLTLDELGSAAVVDVGPGQAQIPLNGDLGSAAYSDASEFDEAGAASAAVSSHENATDPHSQYTTESEVNDLAPKAPGVLDGLRRSVESASGGRMTVFYTALGQPSYFVRQPQFLCEDIAPGGELGTGVHEAFKFGSETDAEIWVGAYQASVTNGEAVSQPGVAPQRSINFDDARAACQAAGAGFDLMTTWDWAAVALWCMANGFEPRGNTNHGRHHDNRWETGTRQDGDTYSPGDSSGIGNILTGSGPAQWRHDGTMSGISDLVGNVWEWCLGLKMLDGRIYLSPDNDIPAESSWGDTGWDMPGNQTWASMTTTGASEALKRALIVPKGVDDPIGYLYTTLTGERLPSRGGDRRNGGNAGLGALYLNSVRTASSTGIGFRPRFRNP